MRKSKEDGVCSKSLQRGEDRLVCVGGEWGGSERERRAWVGEGEGEGVGKEGKRRGSGWKEGKEERGRGKGRGKRERALTVLWGGPVQAT